MLFSKYKQWIEMKCVCGNEAKKIKTELELFDGSLMVRDVEAYYCPSCKEELFTSEQLKQIQQRCDWDGNRQGSKG